MKKILLAATLLAATTASFAGQFSVSHAIVIGETEKGKHIPASEVPAAVLASFGNMYPGATNVRWEREREHGQVVYQAKFLLNGSRGKAVFNADGTPN